MREELEFHDSAVTRIAQEGPRIVVELDAYVHRWDKSSGAWKGEGWRKPARITLSGTLENGQAEVAGILDTGELKAGDLELLHLLRVPVASKGPATLRLEFATGAVLDFTGQDAAAELTGEGSFVEALPDYFKPVDG